MTRSIILSLLSISVFAACGGDGGPHADYSKCAGATKIVATAADVDTQSLALPKAAEVDIGLSVQDDAGDLCDPSGLELSFDDPSWIDVLSQGDMTILQGNLDWFDLGVEPATFMHATLGSLGMTWEVDGVVDVSGTWNVTIYEPTKYPSGFPFPMVVFSQSGRQFRWENCTISQACDQAGTVRDDHLSLMATEANFVLDGSMSSDRARMSGTWSTDKYAGTWDAERAPSP